MESRTNYTLVGICVLLLGLSVILTSLWLSVGFDQKQYETYAVYMNEPVFGLNIQAPVKFNGVAVGYVSHLALNKKNPQQVLLLIDVELGSPISTSTTAVLQSQGITGIRYIELQAGNKYAAPLTKMAGESFPVIPSRPSLWVQLDTALKDVTENFQLVTDAINTVLDKDNAIAIKRTFRNVERFTAVLSHQTNQLSSTINSADVLFKNAADASKSLPKLMVNLADGSKAMIVMAKDMSTAGLSLTAAGHQVTQTMKSSRQAIKQVSQQTLPKVTSLVDKLESVANNIELLTKELKRDPSMVLRGKKSRSLGPGERR